MYFFINSCRYCVSTEAAVCVRAFGLEKMVYAPDRASYPLDKKLRLDSRALKTFKIKDYAHSFCKRKLYLFDL
ncbi:hypothetical protein COB11_07250 [Candidatus Aerophobetes bacterium]|uniref:Uncharacterized protein n=1 Tax=Aerophobetes bacterium TaxID=2030807 RepID=A0A2A4YD10_UNCAE|nr:MAG: hypothetical protein COB11_07250 [Candidatus Aerophobetes bacterium]